jgi:hypothetical protein
LGLNSEEASSPSKDDGLDEVNEAILLALSDEPFSSVPPVRQIARKTCVPKGTAYGRLVDSLHFPVRYQTSDIFIGFLTNSPTVRRQVESGCRSNSATLGCPSGIKDRMGIHINP